MELNTTNAPIGNGFVSPIINCLAYIFNKVITGLIDISMNAITNLLNKGITGFDELFAGAGFDKLSNMFVIMGILLASVIFLYQLGMCLMSPIADIKVSPGKLTARWILVCVFALSVRSIPEAGLRIMDNLMVILESESDETVLSSDSVKITSAMNKWLSRTQIEEDPALKKLSKNELIDDYALHYLYTVGVAEDGGQAAWESFEVQSSAASEQERTWETYGITTDEIKQRIFSLANDNDGNGTLDYLEKSESSAVAPVADLNEDGSSILVTVVYMIILIPLIMQLLRLTVDIVERFTITMLMTKMVNTVAGTLVTPGTSNIFSAYLKMFCANIFLTITDCIMLKGFILLCKNSSSNTYVFDTCCGTIFTLCYLRTAVKMDSYLSSLGVNVAQTGGGLVDTILADFRGLQAALSMAKLPIGMAGAATQNAGSTFHNKSLFDAGAAMRGRPKLDNSDFISASKGKNIGVGQKAFMGGNNSEIARLNGTPANNRLALLNSLAHGGDMAKAIGGKNAQIVPNSIKFKGNGEAAFAMTNGKGITSGYSLSSASSPKNGYVSKLNTGNGTMFAISEAGSRINPGEQFDLHTAQGKLAASEAIGMNLDNFNIDQRRAASLHGSDGNGYVITDTDGDILMRMPNNGDLSKAEYAFTGIDRGSFQNIDDLNSTDQNITGLEGIIGSSDNRFEIGEYNEKTHEQEISVLTTEPDGKDSRHDNYIMKDATVYADAKGTRHTITVEGRPQTVIFEKKRGDNDSRPANGGPSEFGFGFGSYDDDDRRE